MQGRLQTNPSRQIPSSEWIIGKPAPYECTTCTLCKTGKDCPTALHPFNHERQTELRCYRCSACSHEDYTPLKPSNTNDKGNTTQKPQSQPQPPDLPTPYKKPHDRVYSNKFTWYIFVPIEEDCASLIFRYRVALAEMQNAKATIFLEKGDVDWGSGLVFEVGMKETTEVKVVLEEAREIIRDRLRSNVRVWAMEVDLGIWN